MHTLTPTSHTHTLNMHACASRCTHAHAHREQTRKGLKGMHLCAHTPGCTATAVSPRMVSGRVVAIGRKAPSKESAIGYLWIPAWVQANEQVARGGGAQRVW